MAHADPLPTGGTVAQGQATITTGSSSVTVDQTSSRSVLNWNSFSVGADNNVTFNQPNARAATLNRVTGATTSEITGRITSNGAVYLVNPNGIVITSSGTVDTAGGFVASTLDIADSDFMAGNTRFTGRGASARVSNAGRISASQGAYVALLGGSVSNSGYISVPLGRIGLGSGEEIALDINGGNFMQVAMPTNALTDGRALIDQSGSIAAGGGLVQLKAATLKEAVRNIINMSGSISADSAVSDGGTIQLLAGDGGTLTASGTLSARSLGATGNGGTVETSGSNVDYVGLKVDTSSVHGQTGTWLVDPSDLTVDADAADTISNNLATSNVTLMTTVSGASGPGLVSAGLGDIMINAPISWSSGNTLNLSAYRNINVNAALSGGYLSLRADNSAASVGTVYFGSGGSLASSFDYGISIYYNPTTYSAPTDFSTNISSSFVAYMLVNNVVDLQNLNQSLTGDYALGQDIDASATASWNGGAGFVPIGTDGAGNISNGGLGFTGRLDGNNYTISGLTINRPNANYVGLIGAGGRSYTRGNALPDFRNLNLIDVNVVGRSYVGGLFGYAGNHSYGAFSTINFSNINVSGIVTGAPTGSYAGGLIGYLDSHYSVLDRLSSSGTVTGNDLVGGLIGAMNSSQISNSHSASNVTGDAHVGGLIGLSSAVDQQAYGASNVYATGNVTGRFVVGGLFGYFAGPLDAAYSSGTVNVTSGANGSYIGGLIGYIGEANPNDKVQNVYSTSNINAANSQSVGGITGFDYQVNFENTYYAGTIYAPRSLDVGALSGVLSGSFNSFTSSYWDRSIIGVYARHNFGSADANSINSDGGLTTAQLQDFGSYSATYDGWDFAGIWAPPTLAGQGGQTANYYPQLYALTPVVFVDPADASRTYGAANPAFDMTISGGPLNESGTGYRFGPAGDALSSQALASSALTTALPVGQYAIIDSNTATSTGGVTFRVIRTDSGTLTITPASVTVTYVADPASRLYGATNPALTGSLSATGLVNGDTLAGVTSGEAVFSTAATGGSNVGSYAVTGSGVSGDSANYSFTFVQADGNATALAITPVSIIVTALGGSSTYGSNPANPGLSATGLVNGEDVSVLTGLSNSFGITNTTNAGAYTTNVAGTLTNGNYVISNRIGGSWTVNPASIVVTALGGSSTYGSNPANPGLSATGMVNGEDVSMLTGLSNSFGITNTTNAGVYATSVVGTLTNGNYVISNRVGGSWTVNPATLILTYTANNESSVYGSALANLSGTVNASGLVNGETLGEVTTGAVGWRTDATASANAGAYGIAGSGLVAANGNYILTAQQAAGNASAYSIIPASLVVTYTANPLSSIYGNAVTELTGSVSAVGLVNGDAQADALSGTATWATSASATSGVGSYAITGSGLAAAGGNYTITFNQAEGNAGALTITPRPLTITADAQERFYGVPNPVLTYSVATGTDTGLVNGDTLTGALATSATADSPAGAYAITLGSLAASANYSLTYVGADLTVKAPPLQLFNSFIPMPNADSIWWLGNPPPRQAESETACPVGDVSSEYRNEGKVLLGDALLESGCQS